MPLSEARKRANKKWNDENLNKLYDRVSVLVPKGKKDIIKSHAETTNESVNGFINRAIDETMERDKKRHGGRDMKTYTIIGGVNGTGKSSLTGVLKAETLDLGKIIDVDKLNVKYGDVLSGGKAAVKLIRECIEKGISFTQETTLSGHKTANTAKSARENGYFVRLYYVGLSSIEESLKRIENRVQKGGHDIPPEDVSRRFNTRFHDIAEVLPYCDEAVFYDNENGFRVVAEYSNGEITTKGEPLPKWITDLSEYLNKNI